MPNVSISFALSMLRPLIPEENDGLLLQFIYKELISFAAALKQPVNPRDLAEKLTGKSLHDMRIFSWSVFGGPLTQLRYYASLFGKKNIAKTPIWKLFEKKLSALWVAVLRALDPDFSTTPKKSGVFFEKIRKLHYELTYFGLDLAELFSDNENVLYYLVRHQKEFSSILGAGILSTFLEKWFPSIDKAREFVACRYKERGFLNLIPNIDRGFLTL